MLARAVFAIFFAAVCRVYAQEALLKASCAYTRQTAAKKIAKTARANIGLPRLFAHELLCKFQFSMRSELKTVCHLKYRRQNTEDNQTNQNGNDHDDDRRNQLRDHANASVKFALINVGDGLHCFGEMSGLFSYCHHIGKQIWKHF